MNKDRRWLKSVLAASAAPQPALPFERTNRRKPESLKQGTTVIAKPTAFAAR